MQLTDGDTTLGGSSGGLVSSSTFSGSFFCFNCFGGRGGGTSSWASFLCCNGGNLAGVVDDDCTPFLGGDTTRLESTFRDVGVDVVLEMFGVDTGGGDD